MILPRINYINALELMVQIDSIDTPRAFDIEVTT